MVKNTVEPETSLSGFSDFIEIPYTLPVSKYYSKQSSPSRSYGFP